MVGDPQSVKSFYDAIPGSKDASSTVGAGFYTIPCSSAPSISLTFGGRKFTINPNIFNVRPVSAGSSDCVGGLVANPTTSAEYWIVGDVFLRVCSLSIVASMDRDLND